MTSSLFSIGMSGLWAAQQQVLTAGHNIANVDTPGFTRQEVVQANRMPQFNGGVFIGQGTDVVSVRRVYSEALTQQLTRATSQSAQADAYQQRMRDLEATLGGAGTSVGPAIDAFAAAVNQLATDAADPVTRQSVLSAAGSLAARFRAAAVRIGELRAVALNDVRFGVEEVNAYSAQLARINEQILIASGAGEGQQPNDLLDQRDHLIDKLNELVGATAVRQSDGTVNVFIGSGQPLVTGTSTYRLQALADTADPERVQLAVTLGGASVRIPNELIDGGRIGANLRFIDRDFAYAENALGRLALAFAETYNAQHRLGLDLAGALGEDLFSYGLPAALPDSANTGTAAIGIAVADVSALEASDYELYYDGANYTLTRISDNVARTFSMLPQTFDGLTLSVSSEALAAAGDAFVIKPYRAAARDFAVTITDVEKIAAASPVAARKAASNVGSIGAVSLTVDAGGNLDPNLRSPVTITFTGPGTFDVDGAATGLQIGLAYTPGMTLTFNGWSMVLDGTAAAGDTLTVAANPAGSGDNGNARALVGVALAGRLDGGRTRLVDANAQIIGVVGSKAREAQVGQVASENLLRQARQSRESLSGVNLDEEAAKLIRYQQAYQAAGKVIQVADSLFSTLLQSLGR